MNRLRYMGGGGEFDHLRDYSIGDDYRRIDFSASSRLHKPLFKEMAIERHQQVMILLDCGRALGTSYGNYSKLDYTLSSALRLAHIALSLGDCVGFMAFEAEILHFIPPTNKSRGKIFDKNLLQIMPEQREPDYRYVVKYLLPRLHRRTLIVLFSSILDLPVANELIFMLKYLRIKHMPLLINAVDSEIKEEIESKPYNLSDFYYKALCIHHEETNRRLSSSLRKSGVQVVESDALHLSRKALSAYIDIKSEVRL